MEQNRCRENFLNQHLKKNLKI